MISKNDEAFKLKAQFFPITVIKFQRADQRSILQQLKEIQRSAPNYFHQSPVIINLTELKRPSKGLDLVKLTQLLRQHQMIPVGVQGLSAAEESSAQELGLVLWRSGANSEPRPQPESEGEAATPAEAQTEAHPPKYSNRVITKPIRSGTRVYAKQSNLIILAPVSSGAECIADGDIFCYAPVRGRILAGASGDLQAQIFCHSLESELIAIAGYYLLYDECPAERIGHFQILLKDNKLHINHLSVFFKKGVCSV